MGSSLWLYWIFPLFQYKYWRRVFVWPVWWGNTHVNGLFGEGGVWKWLCSHSFLMFLLLLGSRLPKITSSSNIWTREPLPCWELNADREIAFLSVSHWSQMILMNIEWTVMGLLMLRMYDLGYNCIECQILVLQNLSSYYFRWTLFPPFVPSLAFSVIIKTLHCEQHEKRIAVNCTFYPHYSLIFSPMQSRKRTVSRSAWMMHILLTVWENVASQFFISAQLVISARKKAWSVSINRLCWKLPWGGEITKVLAPCLIDRTLNSGSCWGVMAEKTFLETVLAERLE